MRDSSAGDTASPAAPKAISEEPTYRSGYQRLIKNIDNGDAPIWPAP